jgi:hypothetical protein
MIKAANPTDQLIHNSVALKTEIAEGYEALAAQLEHFNNPEAAATFHKLVQHQRQHIQRLEKLATRPWQTKAMGATGEQSSPADDINASSHYLMTPYHAVIMALEVEQRVQYKLLKRLAIRKTDEHSQAQQKEHARHIQLLQQLLFTLPQPESHWHEDLDPPNLDD